MRLAKVGLFFLIFTISACEAKNLYIAHDTVVGINAQISDDRKRGRLVIGYDRDFVTIIPKSVEVTDENNLNGSNRKEVMASLGCNYIVVDGIYLTEYRDMTVTGQAAIELAKNLESRANFFNCDPSGKE